MKYKSLILSIIIYIIQSNYLFGYNFTLDLEKFLAENITSDFTVEYISPEKDFNFVETINNKNITFEILNGCNLRGTTSIKAKLIKNNNIINSKNISMKITLYDEVVVACITINRNMTIKDEYLTKKNMDITNQTNFYTKTKDLLGKITINRIKEGKIIRSTSIREPFDVKINDKILVFAESGNVRVETKVTARQNGYVGDVIKVYNPDFKKTLKAKLISNETGEVVN